ncbi:MarR family winged helix-turn-helix transcriptional regulator [Actinopolymorpha rutila]|uniref:DNA-binding MarR family transcriptional regulator n=1 Tax=Actinopolymorpha rutila TaxID=446787 RepID=A0A852ZKD8_9ACTN|nr:MarR family winged helix-turn-helix transcriptional regulator [Actinopolymorpha rutila]NYH93454.1 DNA-binding MarR family transcriptional regulator [Actinopolymorpha rutila]
MPADETSSAPFLPQLIAQSFALLMDDLVQHLVDSGYDDLRPTHCLNVFRFMDCGGTRPTTLARRAGMTPQAMGELVGYLERHDYVRRVPDATDGRGRVVVYADRGTQAAEVATKYFADLESRWVDALGNDRLADVKSALAQIAGGACDADNGVDGAGGARGRAGTSKAPAS